MIDSEEKLLNIFEEYCFKDTVGELESLTTEDDEVEVMVNSIELFKTIKEYVQNQEAQINTKYKTVERKVRPAATPLPEDSEKIMKEVSTEPILRDPKRIGHKFTEETIKELRVGGEDFLTPTEEVEFRKMLGRHGRAFSFNLEEIGCVDPKVVEPMVIFTIPHIPWNLKPIPVPRARIPQLIELLKEKMNMGILEPSNAPYSSRWFTVQKKDGRLRFIQDMQPMNQVTIRNSGVGPIVDEFAEMFAGRAIYSMGDLYSGYDQFQLAVGSRDITSIRTPIGLLRMCTLPQGATNSVAHMMNGMHKVLRDFIPPITMPFLDDIPIKGCEERMKNEELDSVGCRKFVRDHIEDCDKVLSRLEEVHLTLSAPKSIFGVQEVLVVGHMCGPYGRKPAPTKINAIQNMKEECNSVSEVRRFLGACVFYCRWIPHYAHISDPLYRLLRKGEAFEWIEEHSNAIKRLKENLAKAPALKQPDYTQPIILTVDSSPIGIGWVISQLDEEGERYPIRFGAKVLSGRQRKYAQVKRELWGIVIAIKTDRDYLIGAEVIVETDCLPVLGIIANCNIPDQAMLRWCVYIKTINPDVRHISGEKNAMADMLSRAKYEKEEVAESDSDEEESALVINAIRGGEPHEEHQFKEEEYNEEFKEIGKYLQAPWKEGTWSGRNFSNFRKKAHRFFLHQGYLWKHPKYKMGNPQRVICDQVQREQILKELHDRDWAGHRGVWATFSKIKERYWWPGFYNEIKKYVETCPTCQIYSSIKHRDELHPTYSPTIHYKWMVDIVAMPMGASQKKFLVLAREDLTNQVEGRALRSKTTSAVCQFILEDIICRYGCIGKIVADRGELNSDEAREFFDRIGIRLSLTTAYNPEANGKIERGHSPIVKALAKACKGKVGNWPKVLPYALWADRTTHSSVTGYMPIELMTGQRPMMPIEEKIATWAMLPWESEMSREDLLAVRIRQLQCQAEDVEKAAEKLKEARIKNKARFDKVNRLRPRKIQEGDWVLVLDSSLENQYSTMRKFAKRWFGPYEVRKVTDKATYYLNELDGTEIHTPIAGKRIKIFKRREDTEPNFIENEDEEFFEEDQNEVV